MNEELRECRDRLRARRARLRRCREGLSDARAERKECRENLRECRHPYNFTTMQNINF
jgi:uncharacterized coiled-coil DUF342 family protein